MQTSFKRVQSHLVDAEFPVAVAPVVDQECMNFSVLWPKASLKCLLRLGIRCLDTLYLDDLHVFIQGSDVEGLHSQPVICDILDIVRRLN